MEFCPTRLGNWNFNLKITFMKKIFFFSLFLVLLTGLISFSCRKKLSCEGCNLTNRRPVADAGTDQTINWTNWVTLDGGQSADPDNNITIYNWTIISGPSSGEISNRNAAQTKVTSLADGVYQFELKVTDALGLSSLDTVRVMVQLHLLSGQEFLFDDLTWHYYNSGDGYPWDEIYVNTSARPDLFHNAPELDYNSYLNAEVFLKFDTASNWIEVKSVSLYNPALPVQYLYRIISPYLYVNVHPLNHQIVGSKAAIKVKFL